MIHSFLMIGQSNMAGRGHLDQISPVENPRILKLVNGRFRQAFNPINFDRWFSGISLAETFAELYSKDFDADVGLIPCADGGTCLDEWEVGGLLYDHAVMQAKLAMRSSEIKGILWHQGESDTRPDQYPFYTDKFLRIIHSLRRDLDLPDTPWIVGGLGDYLKDNHRDPRYANYSLINEQLQKIVTSELHMAYVSAEGLTCNPDLLHFNLESCREFGRRYYEAYRRLTAAG